MRSFQQRGEELTDTGVGKERGARRPEPISKGSHCRLVLLSIELGAAGSKACAAFLHEDYILFLEFLAAKGVEHVLLDHLLVHVPRDAVPRLAEHNTGRGVGQRFLGDGAHVALVVIGIVLGDIFGL